MKKPNYDEWLKKDFWTLSEFVLLACGFDPELSEEEALVIYDPSNDEWVREAYAPCKVISDLARRSIAAGLLELEDHPPHIKQGAQPLTFIQWARSKNIHLPKELSDDATIDALRHPRVSSHLQLTKQERRKIETEEKKKKWGEEANKLKRRNPTWTLERIAKKIADSELGQDASWKYIRRHWIR